ncbi:MAG: YkgJ family cysteine cluster protein [Desulfotomaculales bacterium]
MGNGVVVHPMAIKKSRGYDVTITDAQATIGDYLDALEKFLDTVPLDKLRNPRGDCLGCDLCCYERIPLTSIDYFRLAKHLAGSDGRAFFDRFAWVTVDGRAVDITLRRDDRGRCCFLDPQEKVCRVYRVRPFVCRTFTCAPASQRALRLRSIITNTGEDELVRIWLALSDHAGRLLVHEAHRPSVKRSDWGPTPFNGQISYADIRLKTVCPSNFWRTLWRLPRKQGGKKYGQDTG